MKVKYRLIEIAIMLFVAGGVYTQAQSVPTTGLQMWLRADAGVTTGSNNQVSTWADQSGNGNDATQTSAGRQPVLVSNGLNGDPVVRFNGSSSYLSLGTALNSGSALPLTLVVVTHDASEMQGVFDSAPNQANTFRFYQNYVELWSESPAVVLTPPTAGAITSVIAQTSGSGNRLLDVYLNGVEQDGGVQTGDTSPVVFGNGQIGRVNGGPYYQGDIAEVLMYNRALSATERQQVEAYLNAKYGLAAPANVTATPISSSQMALSWTSNEQTGVQIQRMAGTSGTYSPLVTLSGSMTSYVDQGLSAGMQYSYEVSVTSTMESSAYSAPASAATPSGIPAAPTNNLCLWLSAGAGVTSGSNNLASGWSDLSGNGFNAVQTGTGNQPALVPNVLNGQSVLRFNGTNAYMSLSAALSSTSALPLTVVIVTDGSTSLQGVFDSAPNQENTFRFHQNYVEVWNQSPFVPVAPPAAGAITSVVAQPDGSGDRQLNVYVNGAEVGEGTGNNSPAVFANSQIGRIDSGPYYSGDVAEVLVYNQALSGTERQAVESYLNAKYRIVPAPAAPTNATVRQIDPTENLVTWSTGSVGVETTYQVWRQEGSGAWVLAGSVIGASSFLDNGLDANGAYSYEVMAVNIAGSSGFSSVVSSSGSGGSDVGNVPVNGMQLWLMANGAWESPLGYWKDYSGNGNDAWQDVIASQPTVTGSALNGMPVVHFVAGSAQCLALPDFLSSGTAGEIFAVVRAANTTTNNGLWTFGAANVDWYPRANGIIYGGFGSTAMMTEGTPVQNITQFHVYEESSQSGFWQSWLDGVPLYQAEANTVGFTNLPFIGVSTDYGYFSGDIAEVIVYNRPLCDAERQSVIAYLNQKYAVIPAPAVPTGLQVVALSATTNLVSWNAPVINSEVDYQVWRQEGGGEWVLAGTAYGTGTYIDSGLDPNGSYVYKVLAVNSAGYSAFTSSVSAIGATIAVSNVPVNGLQLWLMGDGAWESPVGYWTDYSGNGNDAWQTGAIGHKPTVTANALNGKPVVHFDASANQFLTLPDFLSSGTAGEIIAVVRAANTNATTNNGLWTFGAANADCYPVSNGLMYGGFGSTLVQNEGTPQQDLTQFHVYEESSQNGLWQSWLDGVPLYQTLSNTVGFTNSPLLGVSTDYGYFGGDIAEVLVYNRPLTDAERISVGEYLADKYMLGDFSDLGSVQVDPGSGFASDSGLWTVSGTSVDCGVIATGTNPDNATRRGTIDYSFTTTTGGIWQFQIGAQPVGSVQSQNISIPVEVLVDGVWLGNYTLGTYGGAAGVISGLTQNLPAGVHDLEIINMDYSGIADLQINSVTIGQPQGTDQNGSGMPDWLYAQLQTEDTVNPVPATSYVNPICMEGNARLPGDPAITSGTLSIASLGDMNSGWYANVPLNANGSPTTITATFEGGLISSTNTVTWSPLNVLAQSGTTMTIRAGDSLLLTGYPVGNQPGGPLAITIASGSSVVFSGSTTADVPVPYQFATSGTYSVQASWEGGTPSAITVTVQSADFGGVLFAYVGDGQTWPTPGVGTNLAVQWDKNLSIAQNTTPPTGGYSFNVTPTLSGTLYGVARLYPGGPILARGEVDSYNHYNALQTGDDRVLGTNPDGSLLVQASIVVDNLPPGGYVEIVLYVGGESFPDGSNTEIIPASDFVNGVATFEVDWENSHSICHYVVIYNAQGQVVGSL